MIFRTEVQHKVNSKVTITASTEAIIDDEDEAHSHGEESANLFMKWMEGYQSAIDEAGNGG